MKIYAKQLVDWTLPYMVWNTIQGNIYYVLKHNIPSFVPEPLPSPCCLWSCVVWKRTGRFGYMKLHKVDICPTIAIHVSHKSISSVLYRWYWSCLKNSLASSQETIHPRRTSRSLLGTSLHVCLHSVYPDVTTEQISQISPTRIYPPQVIKDRWWWRSRVRLQFFKW